MPEINLWQELEKVKEQAKKKLSFRSISKRHNFKKIRYNL